MIKSILVPTSGTESDESVFRTASDVAHSLAAHLDFYHVRLSACEAAIRSPEVQFCVPSQLANVLDRLEQRADVLSKASLQHFESFCSTHREISAHRFEEIDQAGDRFVFHARHHDLTVLGRSKTRNPKSDRLIELLLLSSGHPVIIAPPAQRAKTTGTIIVGWKEAAEAARALNAAMPLLQRAKRVVLVGVAEDHDAPPTLNHVARQLGWHGVAAEECLSGGGSASSSVAARLADCAAQFDADLLVVGGYGHKPLREAIFGGVTRELIKHCDIPVFMMH
jgi:nucleotide-binding universal stress UspA family protein